MVSDQDPSEPQEVRLGLALSDQGRVTLRPTARATGPSVGKLRQFCDALSLVLDAKVIGHDCATYDDLLLELHWGTLQLAWLPPLVALRGMARGSAVPLVVPVRGGSAWYFTALFTREDGPIESLEQLRGVRAAWVDPMSSAGYLVIRASLRAQGLELGDLFSEECFATTHDGVVSAVLEGRADVGATYVHFDDGGRVRSAGWGKKSVRVLKFAGPIPGDVLAAAPGLSEVMRSQIIEALTGAGHPELGQAARELFNGSGFERVSPEHLQQFERLLADVEVR